MQIDLNIKYAQIIEMLLHVINNTESSLQELLSSWQYIQKQYYIQNEKLSLKPLTPNSLKIHNDFQIK